MANDETGTIGQALNKLRHYCAYTERSHQQVIDKLYQLGVWKKDHDNIIATLIEEDYLNEERFAKSFARGHFNNKQWGRNKIVYHLKSQQISAYCIQSALKEINEEDYQYTMQKLADDKWNSLKGEKNRFIRMRKTTDFLLQKGFEPELVYPLIKLKNT